MADLVVLGGGFGGITAALRLAESGRHRVTLVDRKEWFQMGLAKLWVLVGRRPPEGGRGSLAALSRRGIRFLQAGVRRIDPASRRIATSEGELTYDALLVALGAETLPEAVPGLPAAANLYDSAMVPGLRDRLAGLKQGRVAVVIVKPPYKCPPAPYEAALLVDAFLADRGRRGAVEVAVYLPEPLPLTVAGPAVGAQVKAFVEARGVAVHTGRTLARVEADGRRLIFAAGDPAACDLLLAIPAHAPPAVVREAGLADDSGWVTVDPGSGATRHPGIWAAGDVTAVRLAGGGLLPKAGLFAEAQGLAAAEHMLAALDGPAAARAFDGKGECWFETGNGEAMRVAGDFFGDPARRVTIGPPSAEAFAAKAAFERDRLARWFG